MKPATKMISGKEREYVWQSLFLTGLSQKYSVTAQLVIAARKRWILGGELAEETKDPMENRT